MKVLVISDTHFPFHSKSAYKKLMKTIKAEKPTHIVQVGDLLDQYVFSKYTRSMSITVDQDIRNGLKMANKMWKEAQKIVPKAKCYQLLGNHDIRFLKRIAERLPELSELVNLKDVYKFNKVKIMDSDRDHLELGGVIYIHGYLSKSIDHVKAYNKPVVHGHLHRPSITFESPRLWSMDVGYMADSKSLPLSYTQTKLTKWTLACGIVEDGKPRLVILE